MRQRDATKGIRACQGLGNVFLFGEGRGNDSQQRIRIDQVHRTCCQRHATYLSCENRLSREFLVEEHSLKFISLLFEQVKRMNDKVFF